MAGAAACIAPAVVSRPKAAASAIVAPSRRPRASLLFLIVMSLSPSRMHSVHTGNGYAVARQSLGGGGGESNGVRTIMVVSPGGPRVRGFRLGSGLGKTPEEVRHGRSR